MNNEIEYRGDWILINAYFYKFWMLRKEFNKYIIIDNDITESFNIQHITSKYSI